MSQPTHDEERTANLVVEKLQPQLEGLLRKVLAQSRLDETVRTMESDARRSTPREEWHRECRFAATRRIESGPEAVDGETARKLDVSRRETRVRPRADDHAGDALWRMPTKTLIGIERGCPVCETAFMREHESPPASNDSERAMDALVEDLLSTSRSGTRAR